MKNFASRIAVFASATLVGLTLVSAVAITPAEARTSISVELSNRPYGYGPDYRRPGWDRGWDRPYRYQPACWTEWHYDRWDGRYPVRICR